MDMLFQFVAVFATTLFAGASLYINLVEHPARMGCSTAIAAAEWAPSYKRAYPIQATLAATGFLAGIGSWWMGAGTLWLVAALCIFAVIPVTFLVIFPTNRRLLEEGRDTTSAETRALLETWGRLHGIRSVLSLIACFIFVGLSVMN